ncbi:hypothetical protein ARALYDRAFT_899856 [Arabidopsis lyrata subsp. lyrata]|uniref:Uncharacterized protein n=1 Tax=Arabidopsis lyrata subsp. lyrata TaxID=81972 RepID=D7L5B9_ARALL|nr:hypothetical protein ARALYDRAFT_899856 [Arabidopsis lyrata subsp. lyrata]
MAGSFFPNPPNKIAERNRRIFTAVSSTAASLRLAIHRSMCDWLLSFSEPNLHSLSLLSLYFSRFSL